MVAASSADETPPTPQEYERIAVAQPHRLDVYRDQLPMVVEVWSPSTGDCNVDDKLPEYQRRGDLESWGIHR